MPLLICGPTTLRDLLQEVAYYSAHLALFADPCFFVGVLKSMEVGDCRWPVFAIPCNFWFVAEVIRQCHQRLIYGAAVGSSGQALAECIGE